MFFGNKEKAKEKEQMKQRQEKISKKYNEVIREMILEEARSPGTHMTRFQVDRIGEGFFLKVPKNTREATNFLNSIIFHRSQIVNISARGDDSLLKDYIVTYWTIDDTNQEIYNSVVNSIDNI